MYASSINYNENIIDLGLFFLKMTFLHVIYNIMYCVYYVLNMQYSFHNND